VGLALTILGARPAFAVGLSSDELVIRHRVPPGQVVQGSFKVTNTGDGSIMVDFYLEDWHFSEIGDGTRIYSQAGTTPRSAAPWISFSPPRAELPPNGEVRVDYTVRVPNDPTLRGGYYAVLFAETLVASLPQEPVAPDAVAAYVDYAARLSHTFMLEIDGTVEARATVRNPAVAPPGVGPMRISGVFSNEGNVVARCERGDFHAQSSDGVIAARGELPAVFADPGQQVPIQTEWSGSLGSGQYSLIVTYDCGDELIVTEEVPLQVP
jgi:hypothetical protein